MKGIISKWISAIRKTPEGRYRNAKASGFAEQGLSVSAEQKAGLYSYLNALRDSSNKEKEGYIAAMAAVLNTPKARQLFNLAYSSAADKELLFAEAEGYLQGILERLQSDKYMQNISFAVKTDADIYRSALVEAEMSLYLNYRRQMEIPEERMSAFRSELRKALDAKDYDALSVHMAKYSQMPLNQLENISAQMDAIVNGSINNGFAGYQNAPDLKIADDILRGNTVASKEDIRQAINILTYNIENDMPSMPSASAQDIENKAANKPRAASDLLALMAAYNSETKFKIEKNDTANAQRAGIQAILAAA
jgi:hypothetical protein